MRNYNFWSVPGQAAEPKRTYRWILSVNAQSVPGFEAEETNIPAYVLTKASRPSFEVGEAKVDYLSHQFKYPGKVTWQDVNLTLNDPIDLQAAGRVAKMIEAAGYTIPKGHFEDSGSFGDPHGHSISKHKSTRILQNLRISMLDADNNEVEFWKLYHPWIKNVTFSELDYSDDGIATIDLTLAYDWASLHTKKVSLNADGTRSVGIEDTSWEPR